MVTHTHSSCGDKNCTEAWGEKGSKLRAGAYQTAGKEGGSSHDHREQHTHTLTNRGGTVNMDHHQGILQTGSPAPEHTDRGINKTHHSTSGIHMRSLITITLN